MGQIRACCVMEQHVGHRAFYRNLRPQIEADRRLAVDWAEITYWRQDGVLERLPVLPAGARGALRGMWQVRSALARASYDVVLYNTQVPAALALGRYHRAPAVVMTDITPLQYDQMGANYGHRADRFAPFRWWKRRQNARLFRQAAWMVPWSNWVRHSLLQDYGVAASRTQVIPPGLDLERWQPNPGKALTEVSRVLFVGGDFQRKGGPLLLEAFRYLRAHLDAAVELAIVTRDLVVEEPGVRIYRDMEPNSSRLIRLYQESDIFCLPTRAEAFGIAAVEAQATGLPAVVACSGGITDIVLHGQTGLVIPPDDLAALTKGLATLIGAPSLRARWGQAARCWALARFDIRSNARALVDLLVDAAS